MLPKIKTADLSAIRGEKEEERWKKRKQRQNTSSIPQIIYPLRMKGIDLRNMILRVNFSPAPTPDIVRGSMERRNRSKKNMHGQKEEVEDEEVATGAAEH